jgi:hypothetical protein
MRVMVLMIATADSDAYAPPSAEAWAAMDRFTEELVAAGVLVAAAGLKPPGESRRIGCDGAARSVRTGPFAGSGETVAGFSIWEVADLDEAVAWAKRCPDPMAGPSVIEIRPFYEAADLAEFVSPEELATPRDGERGRLGVA